LTKKLEKGTLESIAQTEKVMVQNLTDASYNEPASSLMGDKSAIGAMLSMKENTIERGVVGRNGVYAIQLGKRTAPVQINSYEPTRLQLEKAMRKDGNTIYGALREASNVGELQL
jgi:hypothetical protein